MSSDKVSQPIYRLKRFWLAALAFIIIGLMMSCSGTRMIMQTAPSKPKGDFASPPIIAATLEEWNAQQSEIKNALQTQIYGVLAGAPRRISHRLSQISDIAFSGKAFVYEGTVLDVIPVHDNDQPTAGLDKPVMFKFVLVTPKNIDEPIPVIMMQNFCPNHSVIPVEEITKPEGEYFDCSGGGIIGSAFTYFFGRYITTPPIEMILDRGYAVAAIYPHETFPDSQTAINNYKIAPNPDKPWGAIAAWAHQFSMVSLALDQDERFSETVAYGHSRFGKSALVAAAFDKKIDAVIAHQSGTGGASLSRNKSGETVADIMQGYPHWFTPSFKESSLTVDQHHLLALIAPRPIFLGNAKRDVWSDPNGAFRAAQGADIIYELYGKSGLDQTKLTEFKPNSEIAFWMRPGTHGVVKEDWPAFLDFLDAHFK